MTDVATPPGRSRTATRTTTTSSAAESRLRARFRGALLRAGRRATRRRAASGTAPSTGGRPDRPLRRRRRRPRGGPLRQGARPAGLGPRRWARGGRACGRRRRADDRPVALKAIRRPAAGTVRAAGGVLLGELDRATQRFGLAVPSGIVSHTGIGGLTLGGGLGHTMRKFGLTVDNLLAVDLVTATASGSGSTPGPSRSCSGAPRRRRNFGIAVAFEYRLRPRPGPARRADLYPGRRPRGAPLARDFALGRPTNWAWPCSSFAPPARWCPPSTTAGRSWGWSRCGPAHLLEGLGALVPLRRVGRPLADNLRPPAVPVPAVDGGRGQPARHAVLLALPADP